MIARGAAFLLLAALGGCATEEARTRAAFEQIDDEVVDLSELGDCTDAPTTYRIAWNGAGNRYENAHDRGIELLNAGLVDLAREQLALAAHNKVELAHAADDCWKAKTREPEPKEPEPVVDPPLTDSAKEAAALAEYRWLHLLENSPFASECEARMPAHELEEIEGILELHLAGPVTPSTIASLEWMQSIYARHQCGRELIAHWRDNLPTGGTE